MAHFDMSSGSFIDIPNPEEVASYIIFQEGSIIYAKNGKTGDIDFSGTDATTVIQSAINALTSGGTIVIKKGIYIINNYKYVGRTWIDNYGSIYITVNNIKIVGEKGAILKVKYTSYPSSGRLGVILVHSPAKNCIIEGLEIDGSEMTTPSIHVMGLYNAYGENVIFRYNYVHDIIGFQIFADTNNKPYYVVGNVCIGVGTNDVIGGGGGNAIIANNFIMQDTTKGFGTHPIGLDMVSANGSIFTGNIIYGNVLFGSEAANYYSEISNNIVFPAVGQTSAHCDVLNSSSSNCTIKGNIIYKGSIYVQGNNHSIIDNQVINSPSYGIDAVGNNHMIANNYIYNSTSDGIVIASNGTVVTGNYINTTGSGAKGIVVYGNVNTITGNIVMNASTCGILLYYVTRNIVADNICKNNNTGNYTWGDGIRLDHSTYCIVKGNMCYDDRTTKQQQYGIRETVGCDYNIIEGNIVTPNLTGTIQLTGLNSTAIGNIEV